MSQVRNESFITIQGWMLNELHLSGNELLVYAIIYGFSQDNESWFCGSRQYLADWCGCTVRSIQTALNSLVDKKLLIKYEEVKNGIKYCSYASNFTGGENFSRGGENFSLNNITNNIVNDNVVSKDTTLDQPEETFELSMSDTKPKKKNIYQKCVDLINAFTDDEKLKQALFDYLSYILSKYNNEGRQLYENQFKGMLNKLKQFPNMYDVVQQSIIKGYIGFFPCGDYKAKQNPDTNTAQQLVGDKSILSDPSRKTF